MLTKTPALVAELDVAEPEASLSVYVDVLGFKVEAVRPEGCFAYLVRGDVHLMLEEAAGPGRRFRTADLARPFGRGVNFQIRVDAADTLYESCQRAGLRLVVDLEDRWYRQGPLEMGNRQFVVEDPDGYLLRFFSDLGHRQSESSEADDRSTSPEPDPLYLSAVDVERDVALSAEMAEWDVTVSDGLS